MAKNAPVYRAITAHLTELLQGKEVGYELPTIAEVCAQFGINSVQTVRDGVEPLIRAGYVETRMTGRRRWVLVRQLPASSTAPAQISTQSRDWAIASLRQATGEARAQLELADQLLTYLATGAPIDEQGQYLDALGAGYTDIRDHGRRRPPAELTFTHRLTDGAQDTGSTETSPQD